MNVSIEQIIPGITRVIDPHTGDSYKVETIRPDGMIREHRFTEPVPAVLLGLSDAARFAGTIGLRVPADAILRLAY